MRSDIKIYKKDEIQQGTAEWFKIRELKFTASKADVVATNGKGLDTLVAELLAEHYSSQQYDEYTDKYKNPAMQRGNDFESMARMVYEFETGNSVREVGFVEVTSQKHIGCSPDGLVTENEKENGLIEIKNHGDKVFLELVLNRKIDAKYIKQMQYQMWVTGAEWCDYFGFNPNFKPNYYKERIYPDKDMFAKFEAGVEVGSQMIENGLKMLTDKLQVQEKYTPEPEEEEKAEENIDKDTNVLTKKAEEVVEVEEEDKSSDFPF